MNISVTDKISLLREEMRIRKIDIYIIPSIDSHNSEYLPECFERRAWISGFDGSAGEVLVTLEHAYLWTDGRYFTQAKQQLDPTLFTLMKQSSFTPEIEEWLHQNGKSKCIGIDPQLFSIKRINSLEKTLNSIKSKLVFIEENLIDICKSRTQVEINLPKGKAFILEDKYTGCSISEKLAFLHTQLENKQLDYLVLNVLDEIAWLFNIRGSDILYNPLVISYAIIGKLSIQLFVNSKKFTSKDLKFLQDLNIKIYPYENFYMYLSKLKGRIWLDDTTANYKMFSQVTKNNQVFLDKSPIILAKSCKNTVEIEGSRYAHIKDAVAVINFLAWLNSNWKTGIDEINSANKLEGFRNEQENIYGLSFATISGFKSNGAIIHYHATNQTNKAIDDSGLYLFDSGAQYLEGTTDITRTIHLGNPSSEQKFHYTLVLKGHLALGRAIFPSGTCGEHLDVLARIFLWNNQLNYRHGTGHGVGSFLCVHEGPQRISSYNSSIALMPGMILSNEPGFYIPGQYGIRIENLCVVNKLQKSSTSTNSEYGDFYQFENLTLVPYAKNLIDINMLSSEDIQQIKEYYNKIKLIIRPRLEPATQSWLDNELNLF